jgi:hypothetical protein
VSLSSGSQRLRCDKLGVFFIVKGAEGDEGMVWMVSQRCISDMHRAGLLYTGCDVCTQTAHEE